MLGMIKTTASTQLPADNATKPVDCNGLNSLVGHFPLLILK